MKKKLKRFFLLGCLIAVAACGSQEGLTPVRILAPDGTLRGEFQAELAATPAQLAQGLMYRQELGPERGMLFIFPEVTQTSFWMKNTLIPLDMIFIGADKKIVSIVENAAPQTTTPRSAEGPFQYVLEVEGGRSAALGVQPGDKVEFEAKP
ncbi:DUF192 domain-containing protein [Deltaproteobacteria bacterium PRO3]|nr:DUF192 domain-containing protein [Deltaproteobacteria bacterium PRO3]